MRAIVQRVSSASVSVGGQAVGTIGPGLLVYLGVAQGDGPEDLEYLSSKIRYLRVFEDEQGKMNLDVGQAGGAILLVSNFTLLADTAQGRRPAFIGAAPPAEAQRLYEQLGERLAGLGVGVERGRFGESMSVASTNAGPVNILLDTRDRRGTSRTTGGESVKSP